MLADVKPEAKLVQCNVRMPQAAVDDFDTWAAEENVVAGYEKHSRSDIMRDILLGALAQRRATKPEEPKRRKR